MTGTVSQPIMNATKCFNIKSGTTRYAQIQTWSGESWRGYIINFNASLSNKIYGNSNYVQPKSVTTIPIIKY